MTKGRTPNVQRSDRMRTALVAAARAAFADKGYAATGTPEIVMAADATRGALYHHFADKAALFRAVVESEQAAVMQEIEQSSAATTDPFEALVIGGEAFLDAMNDAGRQRILLIDAPAILGRAILDEIDVAAGRKILLEGIGAAMAAGRIASGDAATLADLMNALYDRAALAIASESDSAARARRRALHSQAIKTIWAGLRPNPNSNATR